MPNSFDKQLPKTTTYRIEGQIFFIKNTSFFFNQEEGKAMAELLVFAMKDRSTKGIVIDNREASGAWPKEVNETLANDSEYAKALQNKKVATLTNSAVKAMQTNRLSQEQGMGDLSKTFNSEFNDEVKFFLLGK